MLLKAVCRVRCVYNAWMNKMWYYDYEQTYGKSHKDMKYCKVSLSIPGTCQEEKFTVKLSWPKWFYWLQKRKLFTILKHEIIGTDWSLCVCCDVAFSCHSIYYCGFLLAPRDWIISIVRTNTLWENITFSTIHHEIIRI